jgi:hypothetical protein
MSPPLEEERRPNSSLDASSRRILKTLAIFAATCLGGYFAGRIGTYLIKISLGFMVPAWPLAIAGYVAFLAAAAVLTLLFPAGVAWILLQERTRKLRFCGSVATSCLFAAGFGLLLMRSTQQEAQRADTAVAELVAGDIDGALPDPNNFREVFYTYDGSIYSGCEDVCLALLWSGRMDRVITKPSFDRAIGHPNFRNDTINGPPTVSELTGTAYRVGSGAECPAPPPETDNYADKVRLNEMKRIARSPFYRDGTCLLSEPSFANGLIIRRFRIEFYGLERARRPDIVGAHRSMVGVASNGRVEWTRIKTTVFSKAPKTSTTFLASLFGDDNLAMWWFSPKNSQPLRPSADDVSQNGDDGPTDRYLRALPHLASGNAAATIDPSLLIQRYAAIRPDGLPTEILAEAISLQGSTADTAIAFLTDHPGQTRHDKCVASEKLVHFDAQTLRRSSTAILAFRDTLYSDPTQSYDARYCGWEQILTSLGSDGASHTK